VKTTSESFYPDTLEVEPAEAGLTADGLPHVGGATTDDADRFIHLKHYVHQT